MMAADRTRENEHIVWLDWIRFLAAFAVLASHARHMSFVSFGDLPADQQNMLVAGWFAGTRIAHEAVIVFFVLSGFLVGGRAAEKVLNGTFSVKDYVVDRVSRIMTPLVPAVILTAAVAAYVGSPLSMAVVMGNMLSVQGVLVEMPSVNTPLWSLSYEVWFYILGGSVAFVAAEPRKWIWAVIPLFAAALVFTQLSSSLLICWMVGAAAYLYRPKQPNFWVIALALLLAAGGTLYGQFSRPSDFAGTDRAQAGILIGLLTVSLGCAILFPHLRVLRAGTKLASLGTRLAAFSFSLYLIHRPMLYLMDTALGRAAELTAESLSIYLLKMATCILCAAAFAAAFEANTWRVKRWIKRRTASQPA